jgi:hypothetical protein
MKNGIFWDVSCVALVGTDVSEELSASFIRVTKIGELGTTLAVTSNRCTFAAASVAGYGSPILVTLMKEAYVPPKRRFLQEPHGATSKKMSFFIVTAMKTSNLTYFSKFVICLVEADWSCSGENVVFRNSRKSRLVQKEISSDYG